VKAEIFVEVGCDLGERAGEGKRFPATAGGGEGESVVARSHACDSSAGFSSVVLDE
jgi:hypothetical protein